VTSKQVSYVLFAIAVSISLVLFAVLVKINHEAEQYSVAIENLQKQIDDLRTQDHVATEQMIKFSQDHDQLTRDIDVTQDLQRKQAIAVGELKRGKKR
jgi:SMC interacting uncharacterized protein involved in chromosome segregation